MASVVMVYGSTKRCFKSILLIIQGIYATKEVISQILSTDKVRLQACSCESIFGKFLIYHILFVISKASRVVQSSTETEVVSKQLVPN